MTDSSTTTTPAQRFDRGALSVMALAALIAAASLSGVIWPLLLLGDGWTYSELAWRDGQAQWVALEFRAAGPTPLQVGDQVLSIDGQAVDARLLDVFALRADRSPTWVAGGRARYEVLRAGEMVTLDVPLRRLTPLEIVRTFQPGQADMVVGLVLPITLLIALMVFWMRPQLLAARVMLLFASALVVSFMEVPITTAGLMVPGVMVLPHLVSPWQFALLPSLLHLLLVFPVVKRPLRQRPVLTLSLLYGSGQVAIWAGWLLYWGQAARVVEFYYTIVAIQAVTLLVLMLVSLVHSWFTVRTPVARAQTGWMMIGLAVGFMGSASLWLIATYFFTFTPIWQTASGFLMLTLPMGMAIAILRYRLFDIDVIINRALVYGVLTALLALAYFGVVVVLQGLQRLLTGSEQSQFITVLSTLAIAALFTPVRARVQAFIDRRFYRRKYDAARTLASFSATMRDDVNLGELSDRLQTVVEEAMQPAHVALWLKAPPRARL